MPNAPPNEAERRWHCRMNEIEGNRSISHERQQPHDAGSFDRHSQLALVAGTIARLPSRQNFALAVQKPLKPTDALVVNELNALHAPLASLFLFTTRRHRLSHLVTSLSWCWVSFNDQGLQSATNRYEEASNSNLVPAPIKMGTRPLPLLRQRAANLPKLSHQ